jgi:thimet oligopeptidase
MKKNIFLSVLIGGSLGFLLAHKIPFSKEKITMKCDAQGYKKIDSVPLACAVFPKTSQEIIERSEAVQRVARERIAAFVALSPDKYSQQTVLQAFDILKAGVSTELGVLGLVKSVYPAQEILDVSEKQFVILNQFIIEYIESNAQIYEVFKVYHTGAAQKENLSVEDRYFLNKVVESFELQGLNLSVEKQEQVLALKKQCAQLESEFQRLIAQDATTLKVSEEALAGIPHDFKNTLQREGDVYVLPMDYPVQAMVMNYCSVESTRKQYSKDFQNRAYPQNEPILQKIIRVRDEIAKLLGYESFAAYDLKTQMIKTPERAWNFENDLQKKALVAAEKDFNQLVTDLPEGVSLTKEGKLDPWNYSFVTTYFKKKYYSIDEQVFAEYFPLEKTISALIGIYEQFFNVTIEWVTPAGMWHSDVRLLQVKNKLDGTLFGYIFLDMFPREKKYGHAAAFEAVLGVKKEEGTVLPSVVTLVCNFTKPTTEKPSLLKYSEVTTFFHEFGHAMHVMLGATKYYAVSGFTTEVDFVELPSQMLENWMENKEILSMVSSHYLTGKSLPEELIEKRLELLSFGQGLFVTSQLTLGMVSLELFGPTRAESLADTYQRFAETNTPYIAYDADAHRYCSFGHLMGYGPKYYGYLWSLALAYDVFEQIEKEGLLNPVAGKKYVDAILSCGGSKDANDMLRDYLGREPRFDAFYKKMGLE